jgi:hypothetical protein
MALHAGLRITTSWPRGATVHAHATSHRRDPRRGIGVETTSHYYLYYEIIAQIIGCRLYKHGLALGYDRSRPLPFDRPPSSLAPLTHFLLKLLNF